jgi:hypothetical protein
MNPDLPPIYRGHDIRPAALLAELTDPARAAKAVQLIEDPKGGLIATGLMTAWRHLEGMTDAPTVQQRMKEARDYVGSVPYAQELLGRDAMLAVRAAAHAIAIRPEHSATSRSTLNQRDTQQARQQVWWAKVHDDTTSPYAPAVALLTERAAREQTNQANAKVEAERQATERQRQAERQAAEQAERERQRERQRSRSLRRTRLLSPPVLLTGVTMSWVGALMAGFVSSSWLPWSSISNLTKWWYDGPGTSFSSISANLMSTESRRDSTGFALLGLGTVSLAFWLISYVGRERWAVAISRRGLNWLRVVLIVCGVATVLFFFDVAVYALAAVLIGGLIIAVGINWFAPSTPGNAPWRPQLAMALAVLVFAAWAALHR